MNTRNKFNLTSSQLAMLYEERQDPKNAGLFNIIAELELNLKNLDLETLSLALKASISQHEILSCQIHYDKDIYFGSSANSFNDNYAVVDLRKELFSDRVYLEKLQNTQSKSLLEPYKNLFQITLYLLNESDARLVFTFHHIICDNQSINNFIRDTIEYYNSKKFSIETIDSEFRKNNLKLINFHNSPEYAALRDKFIADYALSQIQPLTLFPKSGNFKPYEGDMSEFILSSEISELIENYAKSRNIYDFSTFLTAYIIYVSLLFHNNRFIMGVNVNRRNLDCKNAMGCFIETTPLMAKIDRNLSLQCLLDQVQNNFFSINEETIPLITHIIDDLHLPREYGLNALFNVAFDFKSTELKFSNPQSINGMVSLKQFHFSKFPLSLFVEKTKTTYIIKAEYQKKYFSSDDIDSIFQGISRIIKIGLTEPNISINEIYKILSANVNTFSPVKEFPDIVEQLKYSFIHNSDCYALKFGERNIKYYQLDKEVKRISDILIRSCNNSDKSIVLLFQRSPEQIITMLACLFAGITYVPINVDLPNQRIDKILDLVTPILIIKNKDTDYSSDKYRIIDFAALDLLEEIAVDNIPDVTNNAYIIFTSGSTGAAKGVVISRKNLSYSNYVRQSEYNVYSKNFLLLSSYSFDSSVAVIYHALTTGGLLDLSIPESYVDPKEILDCISSHKSNICLFTPTLYATILDAITESCQLESLETIIIAGEELKEILITKHKLILPAVKLINEYGPTEATVWATYAVAYDPLISQADFTIGKPISGTSVFVLDEELNQTIVGAVGQLYIAGPGICSGYINEQGKNVIESLVILPGLDKVLYPTGDLVSITLDGKIKYIGRTDRRCKIRGFRVDLNELENIISQLCNLDFVAAIYQHDFNRLVVFYTAKDQHLENLISKIREQLPSYMIPDHWIFLENIPTNINDKIDYLKLERILSESFSNEQTDTEITNSNISEFITQAWKKYLLIENIPPTKNFFSLGGNSITAIQVVNFLRNQNIDLRVRDIFDYPTLNQLNDALAKRKRINIDNVSASDTMAAIYNQSPTQSGLYTYHSSQPNSDIYHVQLVFEIIGHVDAERLAVAWTLLINDFDVLRTKFFQDIDGNFKQEVVENIKNQVRSVSDKSLQQVLVDDRNQLFELNSPSQIRAILVNLPDKKNLLVISSHHIILDGWSNSQLIRRLLQHYESDCRESIAIQYRDYINYIEDNLSNCRDFWSSYIKEWVTLTSLANSKSNQNQVHRDCIQYKLQAEKYHKFCSEKAITFSNLIQTTWALLVNYITAEETICYGLVCSGRTINLNNVENLVGFCAATIPVVIKIDTNNTFEQILKHGHIMFQQIYENAHYGMLNILTAAKDIKENLFDHLLIFQNYPDHSSQFTYKSIEIKLIESHEKTHYPLTVIFSQFECELIIKFSYDPSVYSHNQIKTISETYTLFLEQFVNRSGEILENTYQIIAKKIAAYSKLENPKAPGLHQTLISQYEKQCAENPSHIAIRSESKEYTYYETYELVSLLTDYIIENFSEDNLPVLVFSERSVLLPIVILALIKCKKIYAPIEHNAPSIFVKNVITELKPQFIFTFNPKNNDLYGAINVYEVIEKYQKNKKQRSHYLNEVNSDASQIAYIIHTSGTTGLPKAVQISYLQLNDSLAARLKYYKNPKNMLFLLSPAFDVSLSALLWPLITGGCVTIYPQLAAIDFEKLSTLIKLNDISIIHSTPLIHMQMLSQLSDSDELSSLTDIIVGGEECQQLLLKQHMHILKNCRLHNEYGPTETAIWATVKCIYDPNIGYSAINLGKPISGYKIYILNREKRIVPNGQLGEIYIGYEGKIAGYYRQNSLDKKFLDDWFSDGMTYQTGDLGIINGNLELEFFGRIDREIKINGYRVQLSLIENTIQEIIKNRRIFVAICNDQDDVKYLVAFIEGVSLELDASEINLQLKNFLPPYFIPHYYLKIDSFLILPNGKVDHKYLNQTFRDYLKSNNTLQHHLDNPVYDKILLSWKEIFPGMVIKPSDGFFNLGGNSIDAIRLINKIRSRGVLTEIKTLYQFPILQEFYEAIANQQKKIKSNQSSNDTNKTFPLSPIQNWFFSQKFINSNQWNQSKLLRIGHGKFNVTEIKRMILKLLNQHDVFRYKFHPIPNSDAWEQCINQVDTNCFEELEISHDRLSEIESLVNNFQKKTNLTEGNLYHIALISSPNYIYVALTIHHLLVDEVSWSILLQDLNLMLKREGGISIKTSNYQEWCIALNNEYAFVKNDNINYWVSVLNTARDLKLMPCLYRSKGKKHNTSQTRVILNNVSIDNAIIKFEALLLALATAYSQIFSTDVLYLMVESHGRWHENNLTLPDATQTVGWFTCFYPLLLNFKKMDSLKIKEYLQQPLYHGLYYQNFQENQEYRSLQNFEPNILLNFLGNENDINTTSSDTFLNLNFPLQEQISSENHIPYGLNLNCFQSKNDLIFDIVWSEQDFGKNEIEDLLKMLQSSYQKNIGFYNKKEIQFTSIQKMLTYEKLLNEKIDAYNIFIRLTLKIKMDAAKIQLKLEQVIRMHQIFFVKISNKDGDVFFELDENPNVSFEYIDFSCILSENKTIALQEIEEKIKTTEFHLIKSSLFQFVIIKIDHGDYQIFFKSHHAFLDGWSFDVFLNQFENALSDLKFDASRPMLKWSEYVAWLYSNKSSATKDFWVSYFSNRETKSLIGSQRAIYSSSQPEVSNKYLHECIEANLFNRTENFCKEHGITLAILLQYAWSLVLQRVTDADDVVFGLTLSTRYFPIDGILELMGPCITTVPIFIKFQNTTILQDLKQYQLNFAEISLNCSSDIDYLSEYTLSHKYETLLVFENFRKNPKNYKFIKDVTYSDNLTFPLVLVFENAENELKINYRFDPSQFEKAFVELLIAGLKNAVAKVLENSDAHYHQIDIFDNVVKQSSLIANGAHFPDIKQFLYEEKHFNFEKAAINIGDTVVSYKVLYHQAEQFALAIQNITLGTETVGILLPLSVEYIVCVLGCAISRKSYLPLDYQNHTDRNIQILYSANVKILVTSEDHTISLPNTLRIVLVKDLISAKTNSIPSELISNPYACLMYTSGTTGASKGLRVKWDSILNVCLKPEFIQLEENDKIGVHSNCAFDASSFELWTGILNRLTMVIIPIDILMSPSDLALYLKKQKITLMWLTASLFYYLVKFNKAIFNSLKYLIIGGEVIDQAKLTDYLNDPLSRPLHLINGYGPTEATIFSTTHEITSSQRPIPIGKSIRNVNVIVADKFMRICPTGIVGELYISGTGLCEGYINDDSLSKIKFISHDNLIYFKTSDIGYYNEDQSIVVLGRNDDTIKHIGYRINLNEINLAIKSIMFVSDSVVYYKKDISTIIAYLILEASIVDPQPVINEIYEKLHHKLPHYMLPDLYYITTEFPLNHNGKLDLAALKNLQLTEYRVKLTNKSENLYASEILDCIKAAIKIPEIKLTDNLLSLGLNSLDLMNLSLMLQEKLAIKIPFTRLMSRHSLLEIIESLEINNLQINNSESKLIRNNLIPLSYQQASMYANDAIITEQQSYNVPLLIKLTKSIDPQELKLAMDSVVSRQMVLHNEFVTHDGVLHMQLKNEWRINYEVQRHTCQSETVDSLVQNLISYHIDLKSWPYFRIHHILANEKNCYILFNFHHIIFDGWSLPIFINEISDATNKNISQYSVYSELQKQLFDSTSYLEMMQFWRNYLKDSTSVSIFPTDNPLKTEISTRGLTIKRNFNNNIKAALLTQASVLRCTVNSYLLAVLSILFYRYTYQADFVIGMPVANRDDIRFSHTIGLFINTIPLRINLSPLDSFELLVEKIAENLNQSINNQSVPFAKIIEDLKISRVNNLNPLFQMLFEYNVSTDNNVDIFQQKGEIINVDSSYSKFPLSWIINDNCGTLELAVEFSTDLFQESTINRLINHYFNILEYVTEHGGTKISDIPVMNQNERDTIIYAWNKTENPSCSSDNYISRFLKQVSIHPNTIAVVHNGNSITYQDLNDKSNIVASYLLNEGVTRGSIVATLINRGIEFIISILAIFKTGAAYLPLDPSFPKARLAKQLAQSMPTFVLYQNKYLLLLEQISGTSELLNASFELLMEQTDIVPNLNCMMHPNDLTYVLFTSGSTGEPKGTMIHHLGFLNHIDAMITELNMKENDHLAQNAPMNFDVSVWQCFTPLLTGACVVICDDEMILDLNAMLHYLYQNKVTIIEIVPSLLSLILNSVKNKYLDTDLFRFYRYVLLAGEATPPILCCRWYELFPKIPLINAYGPAECSDDVSLEFIKPELVANSHFIGVGKPIQNLKMYILDEFLNPVPINVAGEIYIGGIGVGLGYINDPALTKEKFIENPFIKDSIIYRTGDLGRFRSDGNIDYMGRIDYQIKVNGQRIELGEIESVLIEHPSIQYAAVVLQDNKDNLGFSKMIIGFVELKPSMVVDEKVLIHYLEKSLPKYMIPNKVVIVDTMPINNNGKIDRNQLLKLLPNQNSIETNFSMQALSPADYKISEIWQSILNRKLYSYEQDFFESGGSSIIAMQFTMILNQKFAINIGTRDIFRYSKFSSLCFFINHVLTTQAKEFIFTIKEEPSQDTRMFIIHPGSGGSSHMYFPLAEFPIDCNIYGLDNPRYANNIESFDSIEAMAEFYLNAIIKKYPHGSYIFAGWSFGGSVAVAMANLLFKKSGKEAPVILIDSFNMSYFTHYDPSINIENIVSDIGTVFDKDFSDAYLAEITNNNKLLKKFKPKLCKSQGYLIKTDSYLPGEYDFWNSSDNGWSSIFIDNLVTYSVPGTHTELFNSKYINVVAKTLHKIVIDIHSEILEICK